MFSRIISVLLVSQVLSVILPAALADELCWTKEANPTTGQPYSSHSEWDNEVQSWKQKQPVQLNIFQLARAYAIYKNEHATANGFKNDKLAHCYIGCRISQTVSYKTAIFLAWYKEHLDLTDCELNSHFEYKDYDATLIGAHAGKNKSTECASACPSLLEQNLGE